MKKAIWAWMAVLGVVWCALGEAVAGGAPRDSYGVVYSVEMENLARQLREAANEALDTAIAQCHQLEGPLAFAASDECIIGFQDVWMKDGFRRRLEERCDEIPGIEACDWCFVIYLDRVIHCVVAAKTNSCVLGTDPSNCVVSDWDPDEFESLDWIDDYWQAYDRGSNLVSRLLWLLEAGAPGGGNVGPVVTGPEGAVFGVGEGGRLVAGNGFGTATGRVAKVEVDTRPFEEVDGVMWFYKEVGEDQATVVGAYRAEGELEMPAELAGRTVTAVGDEAFAGCTDLEGMALAEGVETVGDRAFAECTGLAWVEFPEGLKSIGEKAFQGTGLMAASLPGLESAGEKAFAGCAVLTECTTGKYLEEIPAGMFSGCSNLLSFTVADGAASIGADAFHSCGSLTNLHIGSNVSEVAAMAITNCGVLQVVEAPIALQPTGWTTRQQLGNATVRYYGMQTVTFDAAGGTCEPLSAEFDVQGTYGPLPVPSKDGAVFAGWFREETGTRVREGDKVEPLAAVTLTAHWREGSEQVVDGVSWAFCAGTDGVCATVLGADPLAGAVEMPAELGGLRVAGIASNAFEGCRALQAMRIPAGVVKVGTHAFAGCRQLGTLTVPAFLAGDAGNWGDGMAAVEIVPYAAQRVAFEAEGGTCPVAKAGYEAGTDYGWLPEAAWPLHDFEGWWTEAKGGEPVAATDGVTAETERTLHAHWTDGVLTNGVRWLCVTNGVGTVMVTRAEPSEGALTMPEKLDGYTVTAVNSDAFNGCVDLTGMVIPDSVTNIGFSAFFLCTGLTNVTFGNGVKEIRTDVFHGCSSLESVVIPDSVTNIGRSAFMNCTSLTNVTFGAGVTKIQASAFSGCTSLASAALPDGLVQIQGRAFYNTALTDVRIPDATKEIGEWAFVDCPYLTNVWLGMGIETIKEYAFADCDNLAVVWVPVEKKGTGLLDDESVPSGCEIRYYGTQTVAFDAGAGTCGTATKDCEIGKPYGELPEAEWAGHGFGGWWTAAGGGEPVAATNIVTEETARTLYARWTLLDVPYYEPVGGSNAVCAACTPYTGGDALDGGWWAVEGSVTNAGRIAVSGDVHLILCDGAVLSAPKGITVEGEASFTVWGQSGGTGALLAGITDGTETAADNSPAGIGSVSATAGAITINGGTVTASGIKHRGAGIGGCKGHPCSRITINGGTVTATGAQWAAGIGNGPDNTTGDGGRVEIHGGTVRATAVYRAAGIGGGMNGIAPDVEITGGTVEATGSSNDGSCAGIGGGLRRTSGTVTITGGTVTATPGSGAQAIGSSAGWAGEPGHLSFDGMRVTDPADTPEGGRLAACRASATVTLEECDPHEYEDGKCKWCGEVEPVQTVTFDARGGTCGTATRRYDWGATYGELPDATWALHLFDGWWTEAEGGEPVAATNIVEEVAKRTLYAHWTQGVLTNGVRWLCAINGEGTVTVTGAKPAKGDMVMPETLDGYTVTLVEVSAFKDSADLAGMTIPDSVTFIGGMAFSGCTGLTNATLGAGVSSLMENAFAGCTSLASVALPEGLSSIMDRVFMQTGLTDVRIPDTTTVIFDNAFYSCPCLTNVWLGTRISFVKPSAFTASTNLATVWVPIEKKGLGLLDNVWLPSGCTIRYYGTQVVTFDAGEGTCPVVTQGFEIGKAYGELPEATREGWRFVGWFDGDGTRVGAASTVTEAAARELSARWGHEESVDGVTWIYTLEGDGAVVWGAEPAKDWMRMPDTLGGSDVAGVGAGAFAGCTDLKGMTMPQSVRGVGEGAFAGSALESIRLPDAAEPVGAGAFEGCGALETVWIGPETRTVCTNAFAGCTNLQVVWLHSDWYGRTGVLMGAAGVREEAEYRFYGAFQDEAAEVTWWYWSHEPGRATIMGATPCEGEMALPATVGGDLAVTAVGSEAFWECDGLTGMAIGPGVTNIGSFAFGRSGLVAVTLPDGLQELGQGAFHGCAALVEANLGNGLAVVPPGAFEECSKLTNVVFGENVREIGKGAFADCTALQGVELPAGLKVIEASAFERCAALRSVALPEGLKRIRELAFSRCAALENVVLPESLRTLDPCAFALCGALMEVEVPGGVEVVGVGAFAGCTNLVSAVLKEGVRIVGQNAFQQCVALTNVVLPDGLAEIEQCAFECCKALQQVELPGSLRTLDEAAFAYCTALQGVLLPDGLAEIADWAFYGCSSMTWAWIPQGVESIGREAFANSGILNGKTPDSVTNIAEGAWAACPNMQEAWIGRSVEKVGQGALANCPALNMVFVHVRWKDTDFLDAAWDGSTNAVPKPEGVTIMYYDDTEIDGISWRWGELPDGKSVVVFGAEPAAGNLVMPEKLGGLPVTTIATDAFKDCLDLTGMVISTNVTAIGYQAFGACSNLVSVTLPEGLKTIHEAAFWRSGLTEVAVPAGVTACGDYAFSECPALAKATFGDGLTAFGQGVFMLSPALAEVAIPDSVTDIPAGAFYGCSSLTNVAIPQNVTNIAYGAFAYSGLSFVEIPDAVRTLDDCVFWGCPHLLLVYIGNGVESVGAEAFADCPALREVWLDARWRDTAFLDGTWGEGGAPKPDTVNLRYYGDLDYYVRADGDDANDGLTPETAKREISAAMAVAGPRNTVHVGPGTYGPAMVPQRVILVSDAGAEKTVIRGAEGTRCLAVGAEAVVKGFTLRDGDATANGGGAWMAAGSRMERCIIRDCKTTKLGGAVAPANNAARRKVMVQNCLIVGNAAGAEGGAAAEGVILAHCTVVDNTGPGVRDCAVGGSIVWGNSGAAQAVNCVVEYSLCEGAEGKGNIEGDPLFVGGGNWRLQGASPCIDAATVLAPPVTDDLDGAPRPMPKSFGTGAAALPDMGCYEFAPKALFVSQNGTGKPPYDSWANAASNLQSAVDAAVDGDIVVVDAGTYGPVSIGTACTVVSLRGAAETVIDAQGSSRAVDILGGGTLEGFTIVNGSADDCAGILAESGSTVRDVTIVGCSATGNGGGVCLYGGSTAEDVRAISNSAAFGGGFFATAASAVVRCEMSDNTATHSGGGAWLGGESAMRDSTAGGNTAAVAGGGVYLEDATEFSRFHNNTVENNGAAKGGGIYAYNANGHDCILTGNRAGEGAALWLGGDEEPGFWNCTISGNGGGGAAVALRGTAVLGNTIVWKNAGGEADAADTAEIRPSCFFDNPGFRDEGDFHLSVSSPCIGAGEIDHSWMDDAYDMDGQPRLAETTSGPQADIGADAAMLDAIGAPTSDSPYGVWRVISGALVQLQSCTSLGGIDDWQDLGAPFTVDGDRWSKEDPIDGAGVRFYRLLWVRQ